jgi:hypothetical protein
MLATLDELKGRLGIALSETTFDDELTTVLTAASEKVLDLCGYVEADTPAGTPIVELFRNVQQGREFKLKVRNLLDGGTLLVEGRGHGTEFLPLSADLLDPTDGVLMILGAAEWWPPNYVEERRPTFRRWREPIWPVVRVTYQAAGIGDEQTAPDQLRHGALRLAAYWRGMDKAGATTEARVGQLEQTLAEQPLPKDLKSILGSHYRRSVSATWTR